MAEVYDQFSNPLKSALTRALVFAFEKGSPSITPAHLLWALATEPQSVGKIILTHAHIATDALSKQTGELAHVVPTESAEKSPRLSQETHRILEKAVLTAQLHDHPFISTDHVLFGFLQVRIPEVHTLLFQIAKIEKTSFESALTQTLKDARTRTLGEEKPQEKPSEPCASCGELHADTEEQSALAFFTKELTAPRPKTSPKERRTRAPLPVIGREEEIERITLILSRKTKQHPLLIGDPGVGKSAIVEGLAERIMQGNVQETLKKTRIFALDMAGLLAGAMYRGDFEARLLDILEDLQEIPHAVLFIDEFHTIVGAGSGSNSSLDAANILKPALARGTVRVIGATTHDEYKKHIETDGALVRRFHRVIIKEPSEKESLAILKGIAPAFARHHHTSYSPLVLQDIIHQCAQHLPVRKFPDKAIDVLDDVGARASQRPATPSDVLAAVAHISGATLHALTQTTPHALRELPDRLLQEIFGQESAVRTAAHVVLRAKLGLAPLNRPLASLLFAGPSGVGKTELAKALATHALGSSSHLLRLDMSEYHEPHSASKLIGSPAGYVGYRDRACLTDAVKERPHTLIVFDELEKAHRNVHHLLLQILEEGELRDATGTVVDFRNTLIIATTNATRELFEKHAVGFTQTDRSLFQAREYLEDRFSPELINRFDATCLFHPLAKHDLLAIAKKELTHLRTRLTKQKIHITIPAHIAHTVASRVQAKHGARDVRVLVRTLIEDPLVDALLSAPKQKRTFRVQTTKTGKVTIT